MPDDSIQSMQKEREALRKEVEKTPVTLPSMNEMLMNAAEGYAGATEYKTKYEVDEYHLPGPGVILGQYGSEDKMLVGYRRLRDDVILRNDIKAQDILPVSREKSKEEAEFRTKEECYKKKNRDQEKAARERNEKFSDVTMDELEDRVQELKADLSVDLTDEEKKDTYRLAKREYQKQFLKVVEDLISTRSSKGKWYGNYDSHIALAEEKYNFYVDSKDRIIGREEAKIYMNSPEYAAKLKEKKKADPEPELDLTKVASGEFMFQADNVLDSEEIGTIKKAMKEYRECAGKAYEINKQIEALQALFDAEEKRKKDAMDIAFQQAYDAGQVDVSDEYLDRKLESNGDEFYHHIESLRLEANAWQFHADAAVLCVRSVVDKSRRDYGDYMTSFVAHSAYINEHYGLNIGAIDVNKNLRDQKGMAVRIGIECPGSDVNDYYRRVLNKRSELVKYACHKWDVQRENAATGYESQCAFERRSAEANSFQIFTEYANEALSHKASGQRRLQDQELDGIMEDCVNMTALMQPLPDVKLYYSEGDGTAFQRLYFSGQRDERGEFQIEETRVLSTQEVAQRKREIDEHKRRCGIIRDTDALRYSVKNAILEELPLVDEAFKDIDAFMNVGETKEIFTAKKHEEVFRYTGGLPSFERKARQLRDLISTILQRDDVLQDMVKDPGREDLQKDLFKKWIFMNRVIGFVDYRRAAMERGYNMTPSQWLIDAGWVKGFWDGTDYADQKRDPGAKSFAPIFGDKSISKAVASTSSATADAAASVSQAIADAVRSVSQATASAAASVSRATSTVSLHSDEAPKEGLAGSSEDPEQADTARLSRWLDSMDEIHISQMRFRERYENALRGMTQGEKQFLRPDYYANQYAFSTRQEQLDAIKKDLRKGTDTGMLIPQYNALNVEIFRVSDQLRADPDSHELLEKRAELIRQRDSIERLRIEMESEIDERADTLVRLFYKPETLSQNTAEGMERLLKLVNDPNADPSVTEDMKTLVRNYGREISGTSKAQLKQTVIRTMGQMTSSLEKTYLETANTYADDLFEDMRNNQLPNVDAKLKSILEGMLSQIEKRRNSMSVDSMEQTVALLRSAYKKVSRNALDRAPHMPDFITLYGCAKGMLGNAQNVGKKRVVSFRDWVEVFRPVMDDDGEKVLGYTREEVFLEEEEKATEIRKEQKALQQEVKEEALKQCGELNERLKVSGNGLLIEQRGYLADVMALNDAMLNSLQDVSEMKKDEKLFLSGMGALVISLQDSEQLKGDGLKDLPKEQFSGLEQQANALLTDMLTLQNSGAKQEEVQAAARETIGHINIAYDDIGTFVSNEPGSRILEARHPGNYSRLPGEPEEPDNYSEDMKGLGILRTKTDVLRETINRVLLRKEVLSDEDRQELKTKAEVLADLAEFLKWRTEIIAKARGLLRKPEDFLAEVESDPESWSHEAFVWEKDSEDDFNP